jgi:hypothetical protein
MRTIVCTALLVPILALGAVTIQPVTGLPPENGVTHLAPAARIVTKGEPNVPARALVGTVDTVGGTTYDWWTNGPRLRMLVNSPTYGVHALWMYSAKTDDTLWPDRNMRYNYYDYTTHAWTWMGPDYISEGGVNVFNKKAGYGNVDAYTNGTAVVSCHAPGTAGIVPRVARDVAAGVGIFEYAEGEPVLGVGQWPPTAVGQGDRIHIFPITDAYALSYSHIATPDSWPSFSTPTTDFPSPGWITHGMTASKVSSKVALTWSTNATTPGLQEAYVDYSTDGGMNWGGPTSVELPTAYGGDTVTSCHLSSLFPWYDAQDRFHITANLMPMINDTGRIIPSQIWHYCPDNSPAWSRIAVASVDSADFLYSPGYNATLACRPTIGQDDEGNLFVAWEQFDTLNYEPTTSRARADIWAARSTNNGATWGEALKLTDAGTHSMRFPCVIDRAVEGNPDTMYVLYEIDSIAGFVVVGEGIATPNPAVVQKVPVTDLPVGVAEQKSAEPGWFEVAVETNISYALPRPGDVSLVIYDATGRPVRTLTSGHRAAGRYSATWNASGAAAGIYFCTLESGGNSTSRKIVLTE